MKDQLGLELGEKGVFHLQIAGVKIVGFFLVSLLIICEKVCATNRT